MIEEIIKSLAPTKEDNPLEYQETPYDGKGHAIICVKDNGSFCFVGWRKCAERWMMEDDWIDELAADMSQDIESGLYYADYKGEHCGCGGFGNIGCAGDCFETYFEIVSPILKLENEHYGKKEKT